MHCEKNDLHEEGLDQYLVTWLLRESAKIIHIIEQLNT